MDFCLHIPFVYLSIFIDNLWIYSIYTQLIFESYYFIFEIIKVLRYKSSKYVTFMYRYSIKYYIHFSLTFILWQDVGYIHFRIIELKVKCIEPNWVIHRILHIWFVYHRNVKMRVHALLHNYLFSKHLPLQILLQKLKIILKNCH